MPPREWVVLASLRRARGIRGEIVAVLDGSEPDRFQPGMKVTLVGRDIEKTAEIESVWLHDGALVMKFTGVDTRDGAEQLGGLDVCIPLSERPPAPEGEWYFSDLIGCRVETPDGRQLGEVRAWHEYGAAPLLDVRTPDNRELLVPFAAAFYRTVDLEGRRIVIELPEGLEDL
jgi:16S rRNA processing protein RimM